jgi:Concanavalin A-like lectin/glucanases superfamily
MIIQGITITNTSVYDNTFNTASALLYIDIGKTASYPGSGTSYTDLSGNSNTGTSAGSPVYSNQYGGYSNFNGAGNQYIATATAKYNQTYTGKTVFVVARLTSIATSTFRCLFGTASGTRNFNTYIYSPSAGVYQIHYSAGGSGGFSNNLPLTLGQWFSIAVTHSTDGTVTYYFNGQQVGTNTGITFTQWVSNGNENIGVGDNYWYGDIAVCAAYGRALSADEIQQDHNAMAVRGYFNIVTSNLAIWIDANNPASYTGTGTSITDLSGNNRTQVIATSAQFGSLSEVKYFDCSGTYAIAAQTVGPTLPTTGFTYIVWARMIASSATYRTLFRTSPNDHPLLINAGTNDLGMWDSTFGFYPCGFSVAGLGNTWAQWAVTGDSSGQTFYVNGQNVGSVTAQTSAGNSHNITGNVVLSAGGQSFGYVANMLMYTSKLTQTQIQQNYSASRSRFNV